MTNETRLTVGKSNHKKTVAFHICIGNRIYFAIGLNEFEMHATPAILSNDCKNK